MITIAGGIVLAVLFLWALPYILLLAGWVILIGGAIVLVVLGVSYIPPISMPEWAPAGLAILAFVGFVALMSWCTHDAIRMIRAKIHTYRENKE